MPTLEDIQKGLEQIQKGMATKTEVQDLIKDVTDDQEAKAKAWQEKYDAAEGSIKELQEANSDLNAQIKRMLDSRFSAIKDGSGNYRGVWASPEQAKQFGYYILASLGIKWAQTKCEDSGIELKAYTEGRDKAMGEDANSTGGVLVPSEFISVLIVLMEKYGVFRRNAQIWPMGSAEATAPQLTGDVTVYCPGAGNTITASDLSFSGVALNALKWCTLTVIDSELDEDAAIAVGEVVANSIARAFAKKEDQCAFIGDGTSTYFNILGARSSLLAVDSTPGNIAGLQTQGAAGAWSAIVLADLLGMTGLMPDYADDADAKYYCHKAFYLTVMVAKALAAGGATASEVTHTGYTRNPTFLGRPVEFTSVMPKEKPSADHIPLLLANLRLGAYLGERRKVSIARSTEAYFTTDQIGIRGTQRISINTHGVGDTSNAGPIVGLLADIA